MKVIRSKAWKDEVTSAYEKKSATMLTMSFYYLLQAELEIFIGKRTTKTLLGRIDKFSKNLVKEFISYCLSVEQKTCVILVEGNAEAFLKGKFSFDIKTNKFNWDYDYKPEPIAERVDIKCPISHD